MTLMTTLWKSREGYIDMATEPTHKGIVSRVERYSKDDSRE